MDWARQINIKNPAEIAIMREAGKNPGLIASGGYSARRDQAWVFEIRPGHGQQQRAGQIPLPI